MSFLSNVTLLGVSTGVTTGYSQIWSLTTTNYTQLLAGVAMEIISNSANDTAAGTGARTVRVSGVNGAYAPFSEVLTLNGLAAVPLVNTSVIGINFIEVLTAGSGGTNAGRVDVRTVSGSTVKAAVRSAADVPGMSHDFIYTVPANRYAKIKTVRVSIAGPTAGYMTLALRTFSSDGTYKSNGLIATGLDLTGFMGSNFGIDYGTDGLLVPQKTMIQLVGAMSAGSAAFTSAIGELELYSM